ALLRQDDAVLTIVVRAIILDQQAIRAGVRVDTVANTVMHFIAPNDKVGSLVAIQAVEVVAEATIERLAGGAGLAPCHTIRLIREVAQVAQLVVADGHPRAVARQYEAAPIARLLVNAIALHIPGCQAGIEECKLRSEGLDPHKPPTVAP